MVEKWARVLKTKMRSRLFLIAKISPFVNHKDLEIVKDDAQEAIIRFKW